MGGFNNLMDLGVQQLQQNQIPQEQLPQPQPAPMPGQNQQAPPSASAGPVKSGLRGVLAEMFQNFSYGAGQAMKAESGLPTDQQLAMQNVQMANTNAQTRQLNVATQNQQLQQQIMLRQIQALQDFTKGNPAASLGDLSPDEQALMDSAQAESRMTMNAKPIFDAVGKIYNQRSIYGRSEDAGKFIKYHVGPEDVAKGVPEQYLNQDIPLSLLPPLLRSQVFQNIPMMTSSGPIIINRSASTATPVTGPGGKTYAPPSLAAPKEVADPNNPGQTLIVPAGQSFGQAGVQSASVQVPRKAAVAEVPTNIGNQKVAFTTAIQHAGLLREAAGALQNGNQQQLNQLQNQFSNAFGETGPITAQAIADAYQREVTSVLSKGHMTDSEIAAVGKTINPNAQNYQQINSVLNAYQNLAQSKMNMLNQQTQNAVRQSQIPKAVKQRMNSTSDPLGLR